MDTAREIDSVLTDDDDRAYNASVEMEPTGLAIGWYSEWDGPDTVALEELNAYVRAMDGDDSADFLPDFYDDDLPF